MYNGQAPRSQMNSLCTKQPLNKDHPYITAEIRSPSMAPIEGFHCSAYTISYKLEHACSPAEHSSRPPPITGEKREATEHTEQGEMLKF